MKVPCSVFSLFLFASCAAAQVLSDLPSKPNVIVLQKKWRMEVRNAALDEDQFKVLKEREQEERERRDLERQNEIRTRQGMPTSTPPDRRPATRARGISITHIYEVKIRNTGEKEIRTLTWDYVFFDPGTEREVGRRRFVSEVRIGPGKTRNVVVRSATSPTGAIDAAQAGKKSRDLYSERVIIQSVGYADHRTSTVMSCSLVALSSRYAPPARRTAVAQESPICWLIESRGCAAAR
ncbi:MAG TPA: hypothetical protein VJ810_35925 [Blastocatellia bacterium]|nr:hypothetical protein [Blastocatellia bacterium]